MEWEWGVGGEEIAGAKHCGWMNLRERIGEGIVVPLENGGWDFFFLQSEGWGGGKLPRPRQISEVLTGLKWSPWQQRNARIWSLDACVCVCGGTGSRCTAGMCVCLKQWADENKAPHFRYKPAVWIYSRQEWESHGAGSECQTSAICPSAAQQTGQGHPGRHRKKDMTHTSLPGFTSGISLIVPHNNAE